MLRLPVWHIGGLVAEGKGKSYTPYCCHIGSDCDGGGGAARDPSHDSPKATSLVSRGAPWDRDGPGRPPRVPDKRRTPNSRRRIMLWTIFVILLVLWLLGVVSSYTLGGFIHVLLIVAVILAVMQLVQGRRAL